MAEQLPSKLHLTLSKHQGAVLAVRFTKPGTYCLTCGKDRNINLWNPHNGLHLKQYRGHGYEVRDVDVAKDNSKFASVGGDKQVFLWDVASGQSIRKFRGHDSTVNEVKFGAEEEVLVTCGYDQSIRIWDCRSRSFEPIQIIRHFKDSVTSVLVHGPEITGASVDGTLRRYDIRFGRVYVDELHQAITSAALSKDGLCLLAACLDSRARLVDKLSGELLQTYSGHVHTSTRVDCAFMPSDAHVVCGSEDGSVFYWDLVEATVVSSFSAHSAVVCSLAVHPEGALLLTSSIDGTVKVWATPEQD